MWRHSIGPKVWLGPQLRVYGAQLLCINPIIKTHKVCVCVWGGVQLPPKHAILPVLIAGAAEDLQQCLGHISDMSTEGIGAEI